MNKDSDNGDSSHGWNVISSQYLHRDPPWGTVRKDIIKLANGHIIPAYYVLEYPDWVNTIGITTDHKFILVRQYRHAVGISSYELCAGVKDDQDASAMEAAKRELLEETGYGKGKWSEWMQNSTNPATATNMVHCFLATDLERISDPNPELSEDISVHLLNYDELKALLHTGDMVQASHLAALWKYIAMREAI